MKKEMKTGLMALSIAGFVALGNQTNVLADTLPEVGADTGQQIDVAAAADPSNVTKTVPNAGESTQQSSDVQTASNGAADISDTTKAAPNTEEADQTTENKQQTSEEETDQLTDEMQNAENPSESENEGEKENTQVKEDQEETDLEQSKGKETETAVKAGEETTSQTGDHLKEVKESSEDSADWPEYYYDSVQKWYDSTVHYKDSGKSTPLVLCPEGYEYTALLDGKEFKDHIIDKEDWGAMGIFDRLSLGASFADGLSIGQHKITVRFAFGDVTNTFFVIPKGIDEGEDDTSEEFESDKIFILEDYEYVKGFISDSVGVLSYPKKDVYELNTVLVDGKEYKDYLVEDSGYSYSLSFDESFVEKLSVGRHEVTVRFTFGDLCPTFIVSDLKITEGDGVEYVKGSGEEIDICANGNLSALDTVLIDGKEILYEVRVTSKTIVVLQDEATECRNLDELPAGEHKVTLRYKNGQEVSAVIYVKEAASGKDPEQNTGGETEAGSIEVTEGDEAEYTKGSGKGIAISLKGDIADIETILIDGKEAEGLLESYKNSSAKLALARSLAKASRAGSNVITLGTSLLDGLSVGKHEVTFRYKDGSETTTVIYVKEAESGKVPEQNTGGSTQTGGNPETGNGAQVGEGTEISSGSPTTTKPSGGIKETNSIIAKAAETSKSESPKTGDTGFFGMMAQMLLAFGAAIVLAGKKIRDSLK